MPINVLKGAYYLKTKLVEKTGILIYPRSKSMCGMTMRQEEEDLVIRLGDERFLTNIRTAVRMR